MPKGRRRAIKAAMENKGHAEEADAGDEDEFMMELEAARAAAAEQSAKREENGDGAGGGGDGGGSKKGAGSGLYNKAGLLQKAEEMSRKIAWEETLAVCEFPLELEDVHDDLKREVSFYNNALAAVKRARSLLLEAGVPYKRPDDFLCEMVKTDTHMDKIKDKLIFEQQKMDAFEKRKARSEQRKYAKELSATKQAEKSKRKREAMEDIEQWKKGSKRARNGRLQDDDGLDEVLAGKGGRGGGGNGRNFKRESKDKKFGFGGKKRKDAKNDRRSIDDLGSFNPRQGGSGRSRKLPAKGKNRPGKSIRTKDKQRRSRRS